MTNPRPHAETARQRCPESAEHHAQVWFCTTCRLIEARFTPIFDTETLRQLLFDSDVEVHCKAYDGRADE